MISLFLASILAGIISGAPFGAAGAMVADAALVHDRRRLDLTLLAAVGGNTLLAFIVSLAASPIKIFLGEHEKLFFLAAGIGVTVIAISLGVITSLSRDKELAASETRGPQEEMMNSIVPSLSVFLVTVGHPGSIIAFLFITAFFSIKFPIFTDIRAVYVAGIAVGTFLAFGPVGLVFWKLRSKAEKFVRHFRYSLAAVLGFIGIFLLVRGF